MASVVKFNTTEFERAAKQMGAMVDQVPFALARALNDAADVTRDYLITNTWPHSIQQRNKSFMKAALTTKGNRADKKKLKVAIVDKLQRANLEMHADGGTKTARSGLLALPNTKSAVFKRTARGKLKLKPRDVPDSFKLNGFIYQRYQVKVGGHKVNRRRVIFSLKSSARMKQDVPFRQDFQRRMNDEIHKSFAIRIQEAMASRIASKYN